MPEGDTIFRTAASLRRWLVGRTVTATRSTMPGVSLEGLVGTTVTSVVARGKHLLISFAPDDAVEQPGRVCVLRTHMRMTGSWHVYSLADRWQRPTRQARLVVECSDRVAVGFNIPDAQLETEAVIERGRGLRTLGPDVLVEPFEDAEMLRRARLRPPATAVGELLLDQRVVAGIGNIYRNESLFLQGRHPWTPVGSIDGDRLVDLVRQAAALMHANLGPADARDFGRGASVTWVYRRSGRPCRRCGTAIRSRAQGEQARIAYWCSVCQPEPIARPD